MPAQTAANSVDARCPFLREAQVKYCQASTIKKMIVRSASESADERCSSEDHRNCPNIKEHREDHPHGSRCPFLQESLVQYCAASAVTKYIPYSEASIFRCGTNSHRYCDEYLTVAAPGTLPETSSSESNQTNAHAATIHDTWVDGIRLPMYLSFARNHMWFDRTSDGMCHIGVDAFFTKLFPTIDAVAFQSGTGVTLPSCKFTIGDIDHQMVFPFPINITGMNTYVRANPDRLQTNPYSAGWLFEGTLSEHTFGPKHEHEAPFLLCAEDARRWMEQEVRHLHEFVHQHLLHDQVQGSPVMMDGGQLHPDFLKHIDSRDLQHLFCEFFSPSSSWRK